MGRSTHCVDTSQVSQRSAIDGRGKSLGKEGCYGYHRGVDVSVGYIWKHRGIGDKEVINSMDLESSVHHR